LQATEQVLAAKPDVLLLDIGMPGLNGLDVCRDLRQSGAIRG